MAEVTTEELATLQREFDWLLSQEVPKVAFESVNYQFCIHIQSLDMVSSNQGLNNIRFQQC